MRHKVSIAVGGGGSVLSMLLAVLLALTLPAREYDEGIDALQAGHAGAQREAAAAAVLEVEGVVQDGAAGSAAAVAGALTARLRAAVDVHERLLAAHGAAPAGGAGEALSRAFAAAPCAVDYMVYYNPEAAVGAAVVRDPDALTTATCRGGGAAAACAWEDAATGAPMAAMNGVADTAWAAAARANGTAATTVPTVGGAAVMIAAPCACEGARCGFLAVGVRLEAASPVFSGIAPRREGERRWVTYQAAAAGSAGDRRRLLAASWAPWAAGNTTTAPHPVTGAPARVPTPLGVATDAAAAAVERALTIPTTATTAASATVDVEGLGRAAVAVQVVAVAGAEFRTVHAVAVDGVRNPLTRAAREAQRVAADEARAAAVRQHMTRSRHAWIPAVLAALLGTLGACWLLKALRDDLAGLARVMVTVQQASAPEQVGVFAGGLGRTSRVTDVHRAERALRKLLGIVEGLLEFVPLHNLRHQKDLAEDDNDSVDKCSVNSWEEAAASPPISGGRLGVQMIAASPQSSSFLSRTDSAASAQTDAASGFAVPIGLRTLSEHTSDDTFPTPRSTGDTSPRHSGRVVKTLPLHALGDPSASRLPPLSASSSARRKRGVHYLVRKRSMTHVTVEPRDLDEWLLNHPEPDTITRVLAQWLQCATAEVASCQGVVERFHGDCVDVSFGGLSACQNPALKAGRYALHIREQVAHHLASGGSSAFIGADTVGTGRMHEGDVLKPLVGVATAMGFVGMIGCEGYKQACVMGRVAIMSRAMAAIANHLALDIVANTPFEEATAGSLLCLPVDLVKMRESGRRHAAYSLRGTVEATGEWMYILSSTAKDHNEYFKAWRLLNAVGVDGEATMQHALDAFQKAGAVTPLARVVAAHLQAFMEEAQALPHVPAVQYARLYRPKGLAPAAARERRHKGDACGDVDYLTHCSPHREIDGVSPRPLGNGASKGGTRLLQRGGRASISFQMNRDGSPGGKGLAAALEHFSAFRDDAGPGARPPHPPLPPGITLNDAAAGAGAGVGATLFRRDSIPVIVPPQELLVPPQSARRARRASSPSMSPLRADRPLDASPTATAHSCLGQEEVKVSI